MKLLWRNSYARTLALASIGALSFTGAMAADGSTEGTGQADSLGSLFTEGRLDGVVKLLWFERDFDSDKADWATLAIGGNLEFETAPFYGFSAGVGFKTSQGDLLNDDDKEIYRGLVAAGDDITDGDSYTALDEYYLRYNNWKTDFSVGAFDISSPWMTGFDIRMTPKKYRGLQVINNSLEPVKFHGYYITDWLDWTAEEFDSIASGLTGNMEDNEDALVLGAVWQTTESFKVHAWNYYYDEVLNQFYGRLDYNYKCEGGYTFGANFKYLDQRDVGNALAGESDTFQTGGDISLAGYGAKLSLYYGQVGDDSINNPFGGDYVVIMQTKWLERAEEKVWGVKLDYDFAKLGVNGLSMYLFYADFDTPDNGDNVSTDMKEFDFNIQYKFSGWAENLFLRFRYAHMDQDEAVADGNDWDDVRFHIEYRF